MAIKLGGNLATSNMAFLVSQVIPKWHATHLLSLICLRGLSSLSPSPGTTPALRRAETNLRARSPHAANGHNYQTKQEPDLFISCLSPSRQGCMAWMCERPRGSLLG